MWKCKTCTSTNVESLDWVDLNSGDHLNDESVDEYYCNGCGNNVEVYYEDDEEDNTNNDASGYTIGIP